MMLPFSACVQRLIVRSNENTPVLLASVYKLCTIVLGFILCVASRLHRLSNEQLRMHIKQRADAAIPCQCLNSAHSMCAIEP